MTDAHALSANAPGPQTREHEHTKQRGAALAQPQSETARTVRPKFGRKTKAIAAIAREVAVGLAIGAHTAELEGPKL